MARRLRRQARACAALGSPLYAGLLARVADDVLDAGASWSVLRGRQLPPGSAPGLRLMGGVHRIVLEGRAPDLAEQYRRAAEPHAGGRPDDAWPPFRAVLDRHQDELRRRMDDPVQTNEVGRAAALLGGFLLVARTTGLELRLLEVGASAGLNLRFDRFAYDVGGIVVGDARSRVRLSGMFEGRPLPVEAELRVTERRGCDIRPVDPTTEEGRLTLLSYVWPDQRERVTLLRAAIDVARDTPATVDERGAADWVEERLRRPAHGTATVVFHSIVRQYLASDERERLDGLLGDAAARATPESPIAHLQFEPAGDVAEVRLTISPGAPERVVARAGYHGRPVRWIADEPHERRGSR